MCERENYYILLDLVKYGIDIERYYKYKEYNLIDWQKIVELSKRHRVSALAYAGLVELQYKQTITIDTVIISGWRNNIDNQKIIDYVQKVAFEETMSALEKQHIHYYPFKGFRLKELYPKTYFREMTDLDFFINHEDFYRAVQLLEAAGYKKSEFSNQQVTTLLKSPFITIEIQSSFFNEDMFENFFGYFEELTPTKKNKEIKLNWETTTLYIYLFCHLYKHMNNSGMGIRFLLDLWLFEQKESENIDWTRVEKDFSYLGINDEYQRIRLIMEDWFEKNIESDLEELVMYIFSSGLFGTVDFFIYNKLAAENTLFRYVIKRMFPSLETLKLLYPDLITYPIFLPYYWGKRALHIMFHKWDRVLYEYNVLRKNR